MANSKTKKQATKAAVDTEVNETSQKIVPKEVNMDQYITVRNGFHGTLIYRSRRTGEEFIWPEFGAEQEMELRELRNAKNTSKMFFTNNWFMFDDEWVVDYLGVRQFYKNALRIEDFDNIYKKTPDEIKKAIADMSEGQKRSVAYRASELIKTGDIDSLKTIAALEEALGIELIEK